MHSPSTRLRRGIAFRLSFSLFQKGPVPCCRSGRNGQPPRLIEILSVNGNRRVASIRKVIETLKTLPALERESRISQMVGSGVAVESSSVVDKTMTWDQIVELHAGGVTFGSHTSTHEILTMVPAAQAEREIVESRRSIQQKLGNCCEMFSYPNGDYSEPVRDLVAEAGYKFAFLNQDPGVWTRDCDPFLIPRVNVCEYHLVDAKGNFSPLIFDYAVVWSAAKGLLSHCLKNFKKGRQLSGKTLEAWRKEVHGKIRLRKKFAEESTSGSYRLPSLSASRSR